MNTKSQKPNINHIRFRKALEQAFAQAIEQGGAELEAEEILAITAHLVGQLAALQDQRRYTSEMVMGLITENIAQGNREVLDGRLNETGGNG